MEKSSFTSKQKLREFSTIKLDLNQMLKEFLYEGGKKRPQLEIRKSQMGKFTGKVHTVKVENHPYTNMISNPAIVKWIHMQEMGIAFEINRPAT